MKELKYLLSFILDVLVILYFVQVVTAPMSILNAIAVEAYKKYIMVSLIHHGQVFVLFTFYMDYLSFVLTPSLFFSSNLRHNL